MKIEEIKIISGRDKNGAPEPVAELTMKKGDVVILAGPTGSGKSLLLADIEQLADGDSPSGRRVLVNGEHMDLDGMRITASLSQNMHFMMDLNVESFIRMHARSRKIKDPHIIAKILELANGLAGEPLAAHTNLTALSGGQSRALMIADTALISNAPIVLVDEIENAGINKTKGIEILAAKGKIVLIASHDPSLIVMAQQRIVMKNGSMAKLISANEVEARHLAHFKKIDAVLDDFRERLRRGDILTEETLCNLQTILGVKYAR